MHDVGPAYGLWSLVFLNSAIFILFALSFAKPQTRTDWRSFGAFSAFIIALFAEMYGFPLTIYLLSGWLSQRYPGLDLFSHDSGHLLSTLLGTKGDPHFDFLHILSNILIFAGFLIIASAWRVLHASQQKGQLATDGLYSRIRHPQYVGFIVIMLGFLLQWPTLLTLAMFPVLAYMYVRLARHEEQIARQQFGRAYEEWTARAPAFVPKFLPSDRAGRS